MYAQLRRRRWPHPAPRPAVRRRAAGPPGGPPLDLLAQPRSRLGTAESAALHMHRLPSKHAVPGPRPAAPQVSGQRPRGPSAPWRTRRPRALAVGSPATLGGARRRCLRRRRCRSLGLLRPPRQDLPLRRSPPAPRQRPTHLARQPRPWTHNWPPCCLRHGCRHLQAAQQLAAPAPIQAEHPESRSQPLRRQLSARQPRRSPPRRRTPGTATPSTRSAGPSPALSKRTAPTPGQARGP
mmetsp:Transcript_134809/g.430804  ORF Transcript_134809/g.430804 Transcript_134809/m.430804 type:complete len:238 (+) Transcript_134809:124-837(+)